MTAIGRYEIDSEIGRGSMGQVYLAHDPRLNRLVALKRFSLPDGLDKDQRREYQERFLREARAAASLSHPGIVTVYDVDWDADSETPFIAMEYVPDGTLKDTLDAKGRLEPGEVADLARALGAALAAAHEHGIVHRDVKPANILLREADAAVKVADFGVARCDASDLTRSGAALGSPAYMSPEQIRGQEVDARSDLFSLAVILYEALTGERPFTGADLSALAYAIAHETPIPPSRLVEGLPAGVDAFFLRALAKERERRFADGEELAAFFVDAVTGGIDAGEATLVEGGAVALPTATPSGGRWRQRLFGTRRRRVATFACSLVVLAAGLVFLGGGDAYLELEGRSTVTQGELSLKLDGREVYGRALAYTDPGTGGAGGAVGRGRGLLKKLRPSKAGETFEAWLRVPSGKHEVEATLRLADGDSTYRSSVIVDLEEGETGKLKLVAGGSSSAPVSLKVN